MRELEVGELYKTSASNTWFYNLTGIQTVDGVYHGDESAYAFGAWSSGGVELGHDAILMYVGTAIYKRTVADTTMSAGILVFMHTDVYNGKTVTWEVGIACKPGVFTKIS